MSFVEVMVPNLDCEGCATKLKKALIKLKGVEEIEVDMDAHKVTARGYHVDERKVIKAIKRTGKLAEPWPFPPSNSHFTSFYKYPSHIMSHYYHPKNTPPPTNLHAFFHTPAAYLASDDAVASIFSDDNPHACSIM